MTKCARWGLLALVVLAGAAALSGCAHSILMAPIYRHRIKANLEDPASCGPGHYALVDGVPTMHVYGTAAEMGAQYGAMLKPTLRALHHYMLCLLPGEMKERLTKTAMEQEPFLPKGIRDELHAMADASEMPYEELAAINVIVRPFCSTLAVWGPETADGKLIMGRNAEYFSFGLSDRGGILVVYHPNEGNAVAAISFLGMAGAYTGVNSKGVAFGNMLVFNAAQDGLAPDGMPISIAMRLAAQRAGSTDEMCDAVKAIPPKIPVNVMVADAKKACVMEVGLDGTMTWNSGDGVLAATNYFRSPGKWTGRDGADCPRYRSLMKDAADRRWRFTVADMEAALHRARLHNLNLQSVVFEPEAMRMHLSINRLPASAGPFHAIDLNALFAEPPLVLETKTP